MVPIAYGDETVCLAKKHEAAWETRNSVKGYEIVTSEAALMIRRKKGQVIPYLLFFGGCLCAALVIPFTNIFIYHYQTATNIWLAVMVTVPCAIVLAGYGRFLVRRVIVLDRQQDEVLVNGRRMCALTDVRKVRIGSYIVPTVKDLAFRHRGLYLETVQGEAVEIERATNFGSGIKEVGEAMANFAHVNSVLS